MLYGICFWFLNKDKENILFYDKREEFEKLNPQGKIFTIIEELNAYYKVLYGKKEFVISREAIKIIDYDFLLEVGTDVEIMKTKKKAVIKDRYWHFKENKLFYILLNNPKRFFEKDLIVNRDHKKMGNVSAVLLKF